MKNKIKALGWEIEGEYTDSLRSKLEEYGEFKGDGSIHNCDYSVHEKKGLSDELDSIEFASGKYEIEKLRTDVKKFFDILIKGYADKEFHWNKSMGFHIHVSFKPKTPTEILSTQFVDFFFEQLKKKYPTVYNVRGKNYYCRLNTNTDYEIIHNHDRYRAINLAPALEKHGTIEFRIFPTNSPKVMKAYMLFTLNTINKFLREANDRLVNTQELIITDKVNEEDLGEINVIKKTDSFTRDIDMYDYDMSDYDASCDGGSKKLEINDSGRVIGSNFMVGSRVKLLSGKYNEWENNPVIGSRFECFGKIISMGGEDGYDNHTINVRWGNGTKNVYRKSDLVLY